MCSVCVSIPEHVHMVYMHACMYCVGMYVCMYVCVQGTYVFTYVCLYVRTFMCINLLFIAVVYKMKEYS